MRTMRDISKALCWIRAVMRHGMLDTAGLRETSCILLGMIWDRLEWVLLGSEAFIRIISMMRFRIRRRWKAAAILREGTRRFWYRAHWRESQEQEQKARRT